MNPFEQVTLASLRRRTSAKWRTFPADVLPLWVAEMDVMPAEPVVAALHDALDLGDTGYPAGTADAEALRDFAGAPGIDAGGPISAAEPLTGRRGDVTALAGPAAAFLERGRVAVSSGHAFGTRGADLVRLNFATRADVLEEAFSRMGAVR